MMRNWYLLSIDELQTKKEKILDWVMRVKETHPDWPRIWKALGEVGGVLNIKKEALEDDFLQMVIDTLCVN